MSDRSGTSGQPGNGPESSDEQYVADWLQASTPVPAAGFRGALDRYLRRRDPGYGPRPAQLRLIAAACVGGGAVLVLLGGLQATGVL